MGRQGQVVTVLAGWEKYKVRRWEHQFGMRMSPVIADEDVEVEGTKETVVNISDDEKEEENEEAEEKEIVKNKAGSPVTRLLDIPESDDEWWEEEKEEDGDWSDMDEDGEGDSEEDEDGEESEDEGMEMRFKKDKKESNESEEAKDPRKRLRRSTGQGKLDLYFIFCHVLQKDSKLPSHTANRHFQSRSRR
jgi:hypothetical protein